LIIRSETYSLRRSASFLIITFQDLKSVPVIADTQTPGPLSFFYLVGHYCEGRIGTPTESINGLAEGTTSV
jgi:hypothetical protein